MDKRIVISGSRDFNNYELLKSYTDECIATLRKKYTLIFLSGRCRGADFLGERYAKEQGFKIEYFPAEWEKYGRAAGPKRNEQMAALADYIICFWDGKSKGTASMISLAKAKGIPLKIKRI